MEWEVDEKELKLAGAEILTTDGVAGILVGGWEITSSKGPILNSSTLNQWEEKVGTCHSPEMVFGERWLRLKHLGGSGVNLYFNAFDALVGWKKEGLAPVEVPAAAQWKFRSKPSQQVILDYDYMFTTPYSGSETIENRNGETTKGSCKLQWLDSEEQIDLVKLAPKEPILFYDEVVLYEDELADNGVSLDCKSESNAEWLVSSFAVLGEPFLFPFICPINQVASLRVDGVLMRLRDTRMHSIFDGCSTPTVLRESCWRESTFQAVSAKGYPTDCAFYNDPSTISQRLPVVMHKTQKLLFPPGR